MRNNKPGFMFKGTALDVINKKETRNKGNEGRFLRSPNMTLIMASIITLGGGK